MDYQVKAITIGGKQETLEDIIESPAEAQDVMAALASCAHIERAIVLRRQSYGKPWIPVAERIGPKRIKPLPSSIPVEMTEAEQV